MSLVAHLAHGYLTNKMLNEPTLLAAALSIVPSSGFPPSRTDLNYLEKFVKWAKQYFTIAESDKPDDDPITMESLMACISSKKAQNTQELVYVCVALCRALGIRTRLVISLQPLSSKLPTSQLHHKPGSKKPEEVDEPEEPKGRSKKKKSDPKEDISPNSKKRKVPVKKEPVKPAPKAKEGTRSRRKSAEKPVKYVEPDDSDFEEEKPPPSKGKRVTKSKRQAEEEFQEEPEDDKKPQAKNKKKIISTDSDEEFKLPTRSNKKQSRDFWLEVYLEQEEQWISVDVPSSKLHCERHLEKIATDPLLYVVAFNADLTWKDVTMRYASSFLSTTRKQRGHPGWSELLALHLEKPSRISKEEDETLEKSLNDRPMPTSITELKGHPLYALQRHLLKVFRFLKFLKENVLKIKFYSLKPFIHQLQFRLDLLEKNPSTLGNVLKASIRERLGSNKPKLFE